MKPFALILLGAGLASAATPPTPVIAGGGNAVNISGSADSSAASAIAAAAAAAAGQAGGAGNADGINLGNIAGGSSGLSSLSALSGLNLGGLSIGGLDLGSVNLNSQNDLLNAIELMMGALCLNDLVNANILGQQSQSADIEMFLELAELMQLEASGLINLSEIQTLFSSNSLFSSFNLGVFKRAS
ncbi:hypothetical protein F503_05719 [Ophiostoma piceae UAMH 11346]|uniref:Uncharacterized protein n=1 Tax=Ophiostoma piceae (strain UAMH 11346) TaxID=1262450 RepID=S3CAS5_OPHP1|nr:hypothetical protein F503_05719 [Ophiostoma piceae UAMH 11346]